MNEEQIFRRWETVADLPPGTIRSPADLRGFFERFRPYGDGLSNVFYGLPAGDEVLARTLRCFRPTLGRDFGALINRPKRDEFDARATLPEHLSSVSRIANAMNEHELAATIGALEFIHVSDREVFLDAKEESVSTDVWIFNVVTDYIASIVPDDSPIGLLRDAFRSLADEDDFVVAYLMWPLYQKHTDLDDPFYFYFEIWRHRVSYTVRGGECLYHQE